MNEKESKDKSSLNKNHWTYCPSCGSKLPSIEKQQFCIKCGVDLHFIKDNIISKKNLATDGTSYSYQTELISSKISNEDILKIGKKKLWNSFISIGIPIATFILMNLITAIIIAFFITSTLSLEELENFLLNPYFLIIVSFAELIFVLVPVYYTGKHLQNPTLKNRLCLLGVTTKGYNKLGVLKEVMIGLGFAILGILLVSIVSLFIEFILELIFNIDIVSSSGSSLGDIDAILINSDILAIIILLIIMVLIIGPSEEIMFRGFMQKGLVRTIGQKGGIFITALVFSMIHIIGIFLMPSTSPITYLILFLLYFFPYFAISLLLGLIFYWRKENLIAVIITHGFYDALTILIAYIYFGFI